MERVEVTNPAVGICHMQVCAVDNATDEEILDVCNRENLSGTRHGWCRVIRDPNAEFIFFKKGTVGPVKCGDHEGRTHFLVAC